MQKEGRKKQARLSKQTKQRNTYSTPKAVTFPKKMSCLGTQTTQVMQLFIIIIIIHVYKLSLKPSMHVSLHGIAGVCGEVLSRHRLYSVGHDHSGPTRDIKHHI